MRKVILMMLLATVSSSAMAEWVEAGSNGGSTSYANPATIQNSDTRVKMWRLKNYGLPKVFLGNTVMSDKEQNEYDCKAVQHRLLYVSFHSEKYGKGDVVFRDSYPDAEWQIVEPDSIGEELWKIAAARSRRVSGETQAKGPYSRLSQDHRSAIGRQNG